MRLRLLRRLLPVLLLVTVGWPAAASATNLCVNHGGTNGCYGTIADALTAAAPDATITIAGGAPYLERLTLTRSVSLMGADPATTILDGGGAGHVIAINTAITVTLANLTVRNGLALPTDPGAGIHNQFGTLTLNNVVVTGNHTGFNVHIGGFGGGLGNVSGRLTLNHSVVSGNSTGVPPDDTGPSGQGGEGGEGGGLFNERGQLTLVNSVVSGNSTSSGSFGTSTGGNGGDGGGLANWNGGVVTIINSTIRDNTTGSGGSGQIGGNAGAGGGLYSAFGDVTIINSTISGNQTGQGGLNNGQTGNGGGLYLAGSSLGSPHLVTVTNSTISGNATGLGSAAGTGDGGGLYLRPGFTVTLLNDTIAYNDVDDLSQGGGIANGFASTVTLRNTLLAHNTAGGNPDSIHDCSGTLTSLDYNLIGVQECAVTALTDDQFWVGGLIVNPLADNGGPTQTNALPSGSPAIDAGDNNGCPATDQRGFARPAFGGLFRRCDLGAFELYRFAVSLPVLRR